MPLLRSDHTIKFTKIHIKFDQNNKGLFWVQ